MNLFAVAFRNLFRSGQRTWIVILAMGFAGFIMIYYASLLEGFVKVTEKNAIGMDLGQFQIHAPSYREDPDLYKRITDYDEIMEKAVALGFKAAPRLYGFGLAASGESSAGIQLRGVDLVNEVQVTNLYQNLLQGKWLDEHFPNEVVIGRKLAKTLGVGIGDEIVVVSQAADGSMANDLYHVRGILKSVGEGIDRGGFLMTENSFRKLMAVYDGTHELTLIHPDASQKLDHFTAVLHEFAPGLEVLNWHNGYVAHQPDCHVDYHVHGGGHSYPKRHADECL